jgi:hypothetical protein
VRGSGAACVRRPGRLRTPKETYLAARFRRLAARKGKERTIVAVAHTILVRMYHMLKNKQPIVSWGPISSTAAMPIK